MCFRSSGCCRSRSHSIRGGGGVTVRYTRTQHGQPIQSIQLHWPEFALTVFLLFVSLDVVGRMVYLPMAYMYAVRWQAPEDSLIKELRAEMYVEPYDSIDWPSHRDDIARIDLYTPPTRLLALLNFVANTYERIRLPFLRKRATAFMLSYIEAEDASDQEHRHRARQQVSSTCSPSTTAHGPHRPPLSSPMWRGWTTTCGWLRTA